jgi:hypothetical protein
VNAKTEKDSAGKALYLEFRRDNYTYQMVVMPNTISMDGAKVVPATVMTRRISSWNPRRNWGFADNRRARLVIDRDPVAGFVQYEAERAREVAGDVFKSLDLQSTMSSLFHKGWTLFKTPLVVEFSYKDIQTAQQSKTPNDLIRRIQRSREAAGWGDSYFNPEVVVPTTPAV